MRYAPDASVTALFAPSMSTGLATSTVTPGSTPPLVSRATPVNALWANVAGATAMKARATASPLTLRLRRLTADIAPPPGSANRLEQTNAERTNP